MNTKDDSHGPAWDDRLTPPALACAAREGSFDSCRSHDVLPCIPSSSRCFHAFLRTACFILRDTSLSTPMWPSSKIATFPLSASISLPIHCLVWTSCLSLAIMHPHLPPTAPYRRTLGGRERHKHTPSGSCIVPRESSGFVSSSSLVGGFQWKALYPFPLPLNCGRQRAD